MELKRRIDNLHRVGAWLSEREDPNLIASIHLASIRNPWFTKESIDQSIKAVSADYLQKNALEAFANQYPIEESNHWRRVAVVLAGNIPLVGFHDLLCVYLAGHQSIIKLSDKDNVLIGLIINKLMEEHDDKLAQELKEIRDLLGRFHNQKIFYRPANRFGRGK